MMKNTIEMVPSVLRKRFQCQLFSRFTSETDCGKGGGLGILSTSGFKSNLPSFMVQHFVIVEIAVFGQTQSSIFVIVYIS